jgi:hypothetical protein
MKPTQSTEMKITIEKIGPEKAKKILEANTCNRNVRQSKVDEYAAAMTLGRWHSTGQGIVFLDDGSLGDGQHRLYAIIQSGVTLDMIVVRGVSPSAMAGIDVGAKRSVADFMHLHHGVKNTNVVCASTKAIFSLSFSFQNYVIGAELMKIGIDSFGSLVNENAYLFAKTPPAKKAWIIGSIAFAQKSCPQIEDFAHIVATGEDAKKGNPALTFRNWLISGSSQHLLTSYKAGAYESLFNCMNAFVSGRQLSSVKRGSEGINIFRAKQRKFIESVRAEIKLLRPGKN